MGSWRRGYVSWDDLGFVDDPGTGAGVQRWFISETEAGLDINWNGIWSGELCGGAASKSPANHIKQGETGGGVADTYHRV